MKDLQIALAATCRCARHRHGWAMVPIGKLGFWYLLMILSFVLVSLLHRRELRDQSFRSKSR